MALASALGQDYVTGEEGERLVDAFELADVAAEREKLGRPYLEFFRTPSLRMGLYVLAAGALDAQQPHAEDEVYHVLHGRAVIRVGEEDRPVRPGTVVFVAARVEHRFHTITEDLTTLVFFSSATPAQSAGVAPEAVPNER